MRKCRMVILGVVAGGWLAIACSSGGGGLIALGDGYDPPPNLREKPGSGRETPPSSVDNPGNQGGGPGAGGGASCPPCAGKLSCTSDGKKSTLTFSTDSAGGCTVGDGVTFDCSGRVLEDGQPVGTWTGSDGNYTIVVAAKGQSTTYTCTAASSSPTPTGTGTPTTPTATPTSQPTSVPTDAGTRG